MSFLCCDSWLSTYSSCLAVSASSDCAAPKVTIQLGTLPDGGSCFSPSVQCVAMGYASCCLQDCYGSASCVDLSAPRPSCCEGYCGETPVVDDDAGHFSGGVPTAACEEGPTMATGCCDKGSMLLPAGAVASSEWTVGFDDPVSPDASTDGAAQGTLATPAIMVSTPVAAPAMPGSTDGGGCRVGRPGESAGAWRLFALLALLLARRSR